MIERTVSIALAIACVVGSASACASDRVAEPHARPIEVDKPPTPSTVLTPSSNAEKTASGLVHEPLRPPTGSERAAPHERVRVAFTGFDASGRAIDSSKGRGAYAELSASEGFPGFREALQLLREGEKRRFFIPEELAYKHYPGAIRGDLIYEIELIGIVSMPAPPPLPDDLDKPPRASRDGFASRVLREGTGTARPRGESSGVDVHYTCWSSAGEQLFSTVPQGAPFRGELNKLELMPGMALAVRSMVVGERRRLWLPAKLTTHNSSLARAQPMVCDLELLSLFEKKKLVESTLQ